MRLVFSIALGISLLGAGSADAQQAQPSAVQQFQHIEDNWSVALVNKDQFALDNLLAPTFIGISADAQVSTRNQLISDALASLPEPLLSIEQKVVNVRTLGDLAIVQGTYMLRWRERSNVTRDERGIYTHVYERERDHWVAVNAQRTAVVDAVEGGKKKAKADSGKKPASDLPFHIPLLSHGGQSTAPVPPVTSDPQ